MSKNTKCRKRDNHINQILTIYDFGYKKEWSICAPPWKVRKVTFNIKLT